MSTKTLKTSSLPELEQQISSLQELGYSSVGEVGKELVRDNKTGELVMMFEQKFNKKKHYGTTDNTNTRRKAKE